MASTISGTKNKGFGIEKINWHKPKTWIIPIFKCQEETSTQHSCPKFSGHFLKLDSEHCRT